MSTENAQQTHNNESGNQTGGLARTDVRYWKHRVAKAVNALGQVSPNYSIQIQQGGRRIRFPLGTPNRETAAKKAQRIFLRIEQDGWEAAIAKYKSKAEARSDRATLGEYLKAVEAITTIRPRTFASYARAVRRIYADIGKIAAPTERKVKGRGDKRTVIVKPMKFDYANGGRNSWIERIDALPLATVTPQKARQWMLSYVKPARNDPAALRSAETSANAFLLRAKALFSERKVLRHLEGLQLPEPLPFEGVDFFKARSHRYLSKIDAASVIEAAKTQLAENPDYRQEWKVFLLAIFAGLRRSEIDGLLWEQVDTRKRVIRIEETKYFRPKSEDSIGDVDLDEELATLLQGLRAKARGPFVIESEVAPRLSATYSHYRANRVHKRLVAWLRNLETEEGKKPLATVKKPLHELRKECGALICQNHGIYAAQRFLRHADVRTTVGHYADRKERVSIGLSSILASNVVEAEFNESDDAAKSA